mmetsp:Transcript_1995/g.3660  ORF Transcript_1995/g.3660 Transcript_1995/m.3660 type:complete len:304 (-) Transcript_1995:1568-2479(-)
MTALPFINLLPDSASFFCFAISCCVVFSRPCNFAMAMVRSPTFDSLDLEDMHFLASRQAAEASFSAAEAFSTASLRSWLDTFSKSSDARGSHTFANAWTLFSARVRTSITSESNAAVFLSVVSFRKVATFLPTDSALSNCSLSTAITVADVSFDILAVSDSFRRTNPFASVTALSACAAVASHSPIAVLDSSSGSTSMPFKNGISASWHFTSICSALSATSTACVCICCSVKPSRCFRNVATIVSSFLRAPVPRSLIKFNSVFIASLASLNFNSTVLRAVVMACCAGRINFSADPTSSSDIWP